MTHEYSSPSTIQSSRVVSEFKENFLHLERRGKRLDENSCPDCVVGYSDVGLGEEENIVP